MYNYIRLLTLLLLVVITSQSGYAEINSKLKEKPANVELPPRLEELSGKSAIFNKNSPFIAINDELAMLYSDGSGIIFQKGKSKTIIKKDDGKTNRFWLQYDGKYIYAVWWRKFTPKGTEGPAKEAMLGKQLTVSVSKDLGVTFGKPVVLNTDFGVLPTVSIASDSDGRAVIAFHDERYLDFQVYMNYTIDGGKTWQNKDIRVDQDVKKSIVSQDSRKYRSRAIVPKVYFTSENKALFIWQQSENANGAIGLNVRSRVFNFKEKSFTDAKIIFDADSKFSLITKNIQYKKNILVLVDVNGKGVEGILSKDNGVSWKSIGSNYPDGEYTDTARTDGFIDMVGVGDNIFVLNSFRPTDKTRPKIDISVISLKEEKWSRLAREFDRGKDHAVTKSDFPLIKSIGGKTIIGAWNDYRHLMSTVYLDKSENYGENWLTQPQPVVQPGIRDFKLVALVVGTKKAWIISSSLTTFGRKAKDALYYQEANITDNQLSGFTAPAVEIAELSLADRKKRLEKRVKEFWKLREESNWIGTWTYFDPLYRVKYGKRNWLKGQGKIEFGEFKFEEVTVDESNLALAKGTIELSTSQGVFEEGLVEASPFKTQKSNTTWGWFHDDWYIMPTSFFVKMHEF